MTAIVVYDIIISEGVDVMYTVEDLFDKRSVVGARIEQLMLEKQYTKTKLCKESDISRPTLDKILAGTLSSKTNFEKHIKKILDCLLITPDMLLSNVQNEFIRFGTFKNIMSISSENISNLTGISMERLERIEMGEQATIAELRDVALCLSTSVRSVLGTNFFATQISALGDYIDLANDEHEKDLSGFWGHIGILANNADKYLWYPITGKTRKDLYNAIDGSFVVVPCMNNRVLFLNMENINSVVFLDDACDGPDNLDWDYDVSEGEIPLVVYDALDYYLTYPDKKHLETEELSVFFYEFLEKYIEENQWDEDYFYMLLDNSIIHYSDGKTVNANIVFNEFDTISLEVENVYSFAPDYTPDKTVMYEDDNGAEHIVNLSKISFMDLPLLKVENEICRMLQEMLDS